MPHRINKIIQFCPPPLKKKNTPGFEIKFTFSDPASVCFFHNIIVKGNSRLVEICV